MSDQSDTRTRQSMARAQAAYDAAMPPDDTDDDGQCQHKWKHIGTDIKRDVKYYLCLLCGEQDER
jgi:hypothetical protein